MELELQPQGVHGNIYPGQGSAPSLIFEGEPLKSAQPPRIFGERFLNYDDYALWIIDQHLSVVTWPREHVVQDMHLDFQNSKITPVRKRRCHIVGLETFVAGEVDPFDSFLVEGLRVYLDSVWASTRRS